MSLAKVRWFDFLGNPRSVVGDHWIPQDYPLWSKTYKAEGTAQAMRHAFIPIQRLYAQVVLILYVSYIPTKTEARRMVDALQVEKLAR